jgi:hypothetical protein
MRTLVATLEYGVSALDLDVVQGSLEALASLARQHYLAVKAGRTGITTPDGMLLVTLHLPLVSLDAHLAICMQLALVSLDT